MRLFVEGTSCPVCKTEFRSRLRVIAHLSDARRTRCRDVICSNMADYPVLSEEAAMQLDLIDRFDRAAARKEGHTHPIAVGSAVTALGKRIGHVTR